MDVPLGAVTAGTKLISAPSERASLAAASRRCPSYRTKTLLPSIKATYKARDLLRRYPLTPPSFS